MKVRHDQIERRMIKHHNLLNNDENKYYDIYFKEIKSMSEDLISALRNRSGKGFEQAECLIFDLSSHFHTWNFHRISSGLKKGTVKNVSSKPIKAIPGWCIIFSPDNALDMNKNNFEPRAFWGYILWDNQKSEIKHITTR